MTLDDINKWAKIQWPPSSKNFQYSSDTGIDSIALIRFDVAPHDTPALLESLGFTQPLQTNYCPFPEIDYPDWWINDNINPSMGGEVLSQGLSREIYIDEHNPKNYTVYLRTFELS